MNRRWRNASCPALMMGACALSRLSGVPRPISSPAHRVFRRPGSFAKLLSQRQNVRLARGAPLVGRSGEGARSSLAGSKDLVRAFERWVRFNLGEGNNKQEAAVSWSGMAGRLRANPGSSALSWPNLVSLSGASNTVAPFWPPTCLTNRPGKYTR